MIIYVSIGNSDDKLTQAEWAAYVAGITHVLTSLGHPHGQWFSLPNSPFQNACWCIEFADQNDAGAAAEEVMRVRKYYRQDSVAWAVVESTDFV